MTNRRNAQRRVVWILPPLVVLVTILLAGCVTAAAHLKTEGTGSGTAEETVWCKGDAARGVTLDIVAANSGTFSVRVDDGGSSTVFKEDYLGREDDTRALDGAGGMWRLVVERATNFDGKYEVTLTCGS